MSDTVKYVRKEIPKKIQNLGFGLLAVGLMILLTGYFFNGTRAAFNNLVVYTFLVSVGIGSLLLVAIEYVAGAVWSTPFRRIPEIFSSTILTLPVFAVPLLFHLHDLFHWTHSEAVASDHMLQGKVPYLNEPFFIIRVFAAIIIWSLFYWLIIKNSRKQDLSRDQKLTTKNIRVSAIFIPFFAITLTYTAIDWLMSLEPHWFSTIFGAYYFSGTFLAALAVCTIVIVLLNENGYLIEGLVKDHYYSLGALLFAFVNFWAYIAFSQFLLIWYANLPEETFWILMRWEGSWKMLSLAFILIHFVIPYAGLVSQPSKMNPKRLITMSAIILVGHYMDLFWMSMPTFSNDGFVFGWIELGGPLIIAGLLILVFTFNAKKQNLVPVGDPKLKRGLDFRF